MQLISTITPTNVGVLIVYQGATFKKQFVWSLVDKDSGEKVYVDLSTASIQMQLRKSVNSEVLVDFAEEGYIKIDSPTEGRFSIEVPATSTQMMDFGRGIFQVEVHFENDVVVRLLEGGMSLSREVTR